MRISLFTLAAFVQLSAASGYTSADTDKKSDAFWFRERSDGIIEFTNVSPVGSRWKVLFKTGPGKARALRGVTDRIPARDRSPERFSRYEEHIQEALEYYGVPVALVHAVIKTESDYDPKVVSSVGAMGLMQLMPQTAASMGVTDPFDPRQSILGGSRYLQVLARRFCRTVPPSSAGSRARFVCSADEHVKVISGYHAGPGAVEKYGGMPPYRTTRSYVATVLSRFQENVRRQAGDRRATVGENP
ncbi:MAG: lytic transglycosylase domain-containing protein [Deltaproteobacteria bacterium]|nr:lytic transglycosylase domain-containing protein [Deltaproteobacteria bacterium]